MTLDQIKERIAKIEAEQGDDECAHGDEDLLRHDFIKAVANAQIPEWSEKAALVLSTENLKFARWCA